MIINMRPLTLAEVSDIVKDTEEKKDLKDYLKKFSELSKTNTEKLVDEIKSLNSVKIKDETMIKIADFLPRTSEDVNKIFNDVSLDERETNEILSIVQKY